MVREGERVAVDEIEDVTRAERGQEVPDREG